MTLTGALLSCAVLGLQHGIDVDHVAAITDVTSIQRTTAEATRCGLLYAVGHAGTVGLLGIGVIVFKQSLPPLASVWMERIIGLTLILLGGYILSVMLSNGRPMSRGRVLISVYRRLRGLPPAVETAAGYGPGSSLSLGVLHGVGAETPTQLSVLLIASNLGGIQNGILSLSMFAAGMIASNMALTAAAAGLFSISKLKPQAFRVLAICTAAYSLWVGVTMAIA
jgi:high-affinity nickel-transport protein